MKRRNRSESRRRQESGVALIVVISALVMLLILAVPFVLTGKKDFKIATTAASKMRARQVADSGLEWATYELGRTHRGAEASGIGDKTPDWDAADEFFLDPHPDSWSQMTPGADGKRIDYRGDPRGDLWSVKVTDEQSKINLDSAPPFLLAAIFGRTTLTEDYAANTEYLAVESMEGFPPENGSIVIGGEIATYKTAKDNRLIGVRLQNDYRRDTWVLSKTALDVAMWKWKSGRAGVSYGGFGTLTAIKEAARAGGRAMPEENLDRWLAPFTVYGTRESSDGWLGAQRIIGDVNPESYDPKKGQPVQVRNADFFNAGTIVRIGDGQNFEYNVVVRSFRRGEEGFLWLLEPAQRIWPFGTATIAAEMRHPVNVNNCSRETLTMLLTGIEMNFQNQRANAARRVSKELAAEVAELIVINRPVRGAEHFVELVKALFHSKRGQRPSYPGAADTAKMPEGDLAKNEMTLEMAWAIIENALNPCHRALIQSTMPFGWTSGDVFTIEAGASVNNAAGTELARHRARQTVRTGPSRVLRYRIDSQAEFEEPIIIGRRSRFIETHPFPQSFFTGFTAKPEPRMFRYLSYFEDAERRGWYPDRAQGDVRLQPARLSTPRQGDFEEHFDGDAGAIGQRGARSRNSIPTEFVSPEGYRLIGRPYDLPLNQGQRAGQAGQSSPNSGVVSDDHGLLPFALEFYTRPQSFAGSPTFFSMAGQDPNSDYVRCYYDPSTQGIHLKVHDITIDAPNGIEEAAETVWFPQRGQLEDDTWYHLGAHVGGTRPEQISLHVDGFKRGEAKFQSRLQSSMTNTSSSFTVEDATGWPDFGPVWVGSEVVEIERSGGNTFRVFNWSTTMSGTGSTPDGRGARGSRRYLKGHSSGESVSVFGYSATLITPVLAAQGLTSAGQSSLVVPTGGGTLRSTLYPFAVAGVLGNANISLQIGQVTTPLEIYDPSISPDIDLAAFPGTNLQDVANAFQTSGGYALIVTYSSVRVAAAAAGGAASSQGPLVVELVRYGARQGTKLTGVQAVPNPPNSDLANGATLAINFGGGAGGQAQPVKISTVRIPHDVRDRSLGSNAPMMTAIFPISVHLTSVGGYRIPDPSLASAAGGSTGATEPEFVQIGTPNQQPTYANNAQHKIEWLRYYHIDQGNGMLLLDDKRRIENAVVACGPLLGGGTPNYATVLSALDFRAQLGTSRFGWTTVGQASSVHQTSETVIPVFRTEGVPVPTTISVPTATGGTTTQTIYPFHSPAGYGDSVTLISDVDQVKERHYISWSAALNESGVVNTAFVAFCDNVGRNINQRSLPNGTADRRIYTRICKFPTGELPLISRGGQAYIGGDTSGRMTGGGLIDEIRLRGLAPERYVLWDDQTMDPPGTTQIPDPLPLGINASDTDIPVTMSTWPVRINVTLQTGWLADLRQLDYNQNPNALPPDAGLIQIDDEIIAYGSINTTQNGFRLGDCERGFMNTTATAHSFGANVVLLDWRAISKIAGGCDANAYQIPIESDADFAPFGGTALIGNEMIHFTRAAGNTLFMPYGIDSSGSDRGLFRGRYGTRIGGHQASEFVLDMPFRYWDRYSPESDDPELSFYEFAVNQPGAFFTDLSWRHKFAKPNLGMRIACRLDPRVRWDAPAQEQKGRIRYFDSESGQTEGKTNAVRLDVNGDGMDARVYFIYQPEAFDPVDLRSNAWKETPILEMADVGYIVSPQVLSRETLR